MGPGRVNANVKFRSPAFSLQGKVKNSGGISAEAEIVAVSRQSGEIHEAVADKNNRFSLVGLAPGTYRIFAWPQRDAIAYRNPHDLERYIEDSVEVFVGPGRVVSELELTPSTKRR